MAECVATEGDPPRAVDLCGQCGRVPVLLTLNAQQPGLDRGTNQSTAALAALAEALPFLVIHGIVISRLSGHHAGLLGSTRVTAGRGVRRKTNPTGGNCPRPDP